MVPVEEGSQTLRKVYRFQCRCGAVHVVSANGFTGRRNREDLMRVMKRGGWVLGNDAAHDLCPDCSCSSRSAKRVAQAQAATTASNEEEVIMSSPEPAASPEPASNKPREMGIDDALLIYERLSDVYDTTKKLYLDEWTDTKVASDLGVPRAWVASVRDKRFGPCGSNEKIDKLIFEAADLGKKISDLRDQQLRLIEQGAALQDRAELISKRIAEIRKAVL